MNSLLEMLNLRSGPFLRFAWSMLWQTSLLIALLFVLDFVLRKRVRATVRYALWMLVLLKLVLPVSFSLPTSPGRWVAVPESMAMDEAMSPPWLEDVQPPPPMTNPKMARASQPAPIVPQPVPFPALTWPAIVVAFWFCVVVMLTALHLLRARQAHRITARAAATDEFNELLKECAQKIGVRSRVSLKLSDTLDTPAVCGLFRPVVLLPKPLASKLDAPQMRAVLLHELAHVRRKDLWVSLLQTALHIFYFYNPFLWLADAVIRRAREEAVDEMVLVAMADEAAVYPETLVNVARYSMQAPRLAFGFAGILESKSTLGRRIRFMLRRPWPTSAKLGLPAALALLILALVLLPTGYSNRLNPTYQDPDAGIAKTAAQWWGQMNFDQNKDQLNDDEQDKYEDGLHAFVHLGKRGVPFLRKKLAQGKRDQSKAAFVLSYIGIENSPAIASALPDLIAAVKLHDGESSEYAAEALGEIGPEARAAVPALFDAVQNGTGYGAAGGALLRIEPDNPKLLPAMLEALQKFSGPIPSGRAVRNHEAFVHHTMAILPGLGPRAAAAIPLLREMLQNTNGTSAKSEYRYYAARTLLQIATNQPDIVAEANKVEQSWPGDDIPALVAAAEKARGTAGHFDAFEKLSRAVGNAYDHGTPVSGTLFQERILPLYSEALDSGNQKLVDEAVVGFWSLGSNAAPLLPKLIKIAELDDPSRFGNALGEIIQIAPEDPATLPLLLRVLNATNPRRDVPFQVCEALSHFGPEAAAAVPGLHKYLGNHDIWMRFQATFALWRIAKEPPSMAILQEALKDNPDTNTDDDSTSLRVLEMLGGMTTQTAETKSILRQLAKSTTPEVQSKALALLEKLGANRTTQ